MLKIDSPINERLLGSRLNQALGQQRRGEFALLLAMLSQDVCQQSQFSGMTPSPDTSSLLYQQLDVPAPAPYLREITPDRPLINHAQQFYVGGMPCFRLQQCLTPEPVLSRGQQPAYMLDALLNTDLHTQRQARGESIPSAEIEMDFLQNLSLQKKLVI
ncbi:queD-like protein [Shewanella sp. NFH-SH190041]|uniref:VC2046/SO_2500 family protein n=1 Tax=Shewanella sp. NFH-SH190041 TaxID=2950245 RepID=UPI0021C39266|nr:VC2046/SO_2500 family protein [Shewanella sp. NFH-SH190041]BDM64020.1 queD-like protein [Shewanella sp. NFH-SH190041]